MIYIVFYTDNIHIIIILQHTNNTNHNIITFYCSIVFSTRSVVIFLLNIFSMTSFAAFIPSSGRTAESKVFSLSGFVMVPVSSL